MYSKMSSVISLIIVLNIARIVNCIPTKPDIEPENYRLVFNDPDGCVRSECTTFIAIDINSGDSSFLDIYLEGQANGYVAVGFSNTPNMFSADVVACVRDPVTDFVQSLDVWNVPPPSRDNQIDPSGNQDIVQFNATFENGRLNCSVAKSISGTDVSAGFDLPLDAEQGLYVLTARLPGDLISEVPGLVYHGSGLGRILSANPVFLVQPTTQIPSTTVSPETPPTNTDPIEATVTNTAPSILDEGSDFQVCVSLSSEPTNPVEVIVQSLESATVSAEDGIDFSSINATLIFQPLGTVLEEQCVTISIFEDSVIEQLEFFSVRVTTTSMGITLTGTTQLSPLISDTTVAVFGFVQTSYILPEDSTTLVCVTLVNTTIEGPNSITIALTALPGTAQVNGDFILPSPVSLTFTSTTPPGGECISSGIIDDDIVEAQESYTLSIISQSSNAIVSPEFGTTVITIIDNDGVTMSLGSASDSTVSVNEGDRGLTPVDVCVTLTDIKGGLFRSVPVNLTTIQVTADPDDYEVLVDEQWEIPPTTAVGERVCHSVNVFGDMITEANEVFRVQVEPGNDNDAFTGTNLVQVTILDDGDITDCGVPPPIGQTVIQLTSTTFESEAVYTCTFGYEFNSGQPTFTRVCLSSGQWSNLDDAPICVITDCGFPPPINRTTVQFATTTFLSLATYMCEPGYEFNSGLPGVFTRECLPSGEWSNLDNESTCELRSALIGFVSPTVTVSEGADAAVLCYSINEDSLIERNDDLFVQLTVIIVDSTATVFTDYMPPSSSVQVTFGRNISVDCFRIPIVEDSLLEGAENFTVSLLSGDPSLALISQDTVEVIIVETCIDGEIRLRGGIDELQGRVEVCFNATWGTVCDDGWDDTDARVVCSQLGYPNSEVVRGIPNAIFGEGEGPILLDNVMCNGNEPKLASCPHNGFNVHDCDHRGDASVDCLYVSFDVLTFDAMEGDGSTQVCLRLTSSILPRDVSVDVATISGFGSAVAGLDYASVADTLFFFTGQTQGTQQCVSIPIIDDVLCEMQESFDVSVASDPEVRLNGLFGGSFGTFILVLDNDVCTVAFEDDRYDVLEGPGDMTQLVCLTKLNNVNLQDPVEVQVTTIGNQKTAGQDFIPFSGVVVFQPGQDTQCVTIQLLGDDIDEPDECLIVRAASQSASLVIVNVPSTNSPDTLICCIDNNVNMFGFEFPFIDVPEQGPAGECCVILEMGTLGTGVSITVTTMDGTAIGGQDFIAGPFVFTLDYPALSGPGTRRCINTSVLNDNQVEGQESYTLTLSSNDVNVTFIAGRDTKTVNIIEDPNDTVPICLQPPAVDTVLEDIGSHLECVQIGGLPHRLEKVVSLTLRTSNGPVVETDAQDSIDYIGGNQIIFFDPVNQNDIICVHIPIVDDNIFENDESFTVNLISSDPCVTINQFMCTGTVIIEDNDDNTFQFVGPDSVIDVPEQGPQAQCCIELLGLHVLGSQIIIEVNVVPTVPVSAQVGQGLDVAPNVATLFFPAETTPGSPQAIQCFPTTVLNDNQVEATESYLLVASSTNQRVLFTPGRDVKTVNIIEDPNDNIPICLQPPSVDMVSEDDGSHQECVQITGLPDKLEKAVSLAISTSNGPVVETDAQDLIDYIDRDQLIIFDPVNQNDVICVDIPIVDDNIFENDESFTVNLMSNDPCVTVNQFMCTGTVIIEDNDAVCEDDEFTCVPENRCLPMSFVCDGIPDCLFGGSTQLDEVNCTTDCVDGELRPLLGGSSDSEGIVEVCVSGQFRTLTLVRGLGDNQREYLTVREATVICKQLGQGTAGFPLLGRAEFGFEVATTDSSGIAFLQCQGTENRVTECDLSVGAFDIRQAGVRCINATPCIDGSVRLADGPDERKGRVEVCFQNAWGVVYDSDWGAMDAAVVCRELGYDFNGAIPISPALYGDLDSVRPVAIVNPICRTENRNLSNCSSADIETIFDDIRFQDFSQTGFRDVVGVQCEAYSTGNCSHLDVRLGLRDNVVGSSGLVEICNDGVWSPLFLPDDFDFFLAEVVCRQLGFGTSNEESQEVLYDFFESSDISIATPPFNPPLLCEGFEEALVECINSSSSGPFNVDVLLQAGVYCSAPPRVFSYPPSLDGVYEIELGRPANISCRWDTRISPPVTMIEFEVNNNAQDRSKRQGMSDAPPAIELFRSESVEPTDERVYRCFATNVFGVTVSQIITVIVRGPEGVGDSAFIRFSVPAIERLNATSGPDSIFQDREELLRLVQDTVILPVIDDDTPGLQTVECYFIPQGVFEVERDLDRVECNITQYQRSEEPVVPVAQIAQRAVFAVENTISVFVLGESSANGFCNSEVTTSGEQVFFWPEARGTTTVSIPCPTDTSVMVTRMCGELGQWEEPNVEPCRRTRPPVQFCEAQNFTFPGEAATYNWPQTPAGETASLRCISSEEDIFVVRFCAPNGEWDNFDDDVCGTLDDGLEMLLNQTVNNNTYVGLTSELSMILNVSESNVADQGQGNLRMVAQVFEMIADFVNGSDIEIAPAVVQSLVQSLDSLLQWNATVLVDDSSSNVVESFEVVVALFAQQVEIGENETIIVEDLVFVAERTSLETLQENGRGFSFSEPSDNERVVELGGDDQVTPGGLAPQQVAAIRLPASLFQTIQNGSQTPEGSVGIFFAVYDVPSLFPLNEENRTVASRVLSSTIGPGIDISNLTEPLSIVLRVNTSQIEPGTEMCVSWDFLLNEWTTEGCVTGVGSDGVVTCNCTHLTNFAVLVDLCTRVDGCETNETFDTVLSFITIIGVSISMVGLALTVLTMLIFKNIRQKDASKYHIQLSIAIFCMLLVFVVGIERTENYGGCVTVSVLIHYFTLVAVMWMGAEALLMFQKLVIVFIRITTKFIVILSFICWLVPLLPVAIPLIVDLSTGNDTDIVVNRDQFCFLNHIGALYGAFIALILLVVIFNLVVFIIVIYVLIKHTRGQLSRQQERMKPAAAVRLMISITGVMFLFGLSWLFAALSITNPGVRYTFQVLFTVFTAFQGFFIFLFFCVFSKEARESWKEFLSFGKYKSELLHPSQYKQPSSSATTKRANYKTGTTGSTGISMSTFGRPSVSDTISKTDYNSETLQKTVFGSEENRPALIYENPVSTFETSTFEASAFETYYNTYTEPPAAVVQPESDKFETIPPRESLELSVEEIYTEIGTEGSSMELLNSKKLSDHEPIGGVRYSEQDKDVDGRSSTDSNAQSHENGDAKELKPLKARVRRFSTRKAYAHHVESMQVDFYSDASDGEEL